MRTRFPKRRALDYHGKIVYVPEGEDPRFVNMPSTVKYPYIKDTAAFIYEKYAEGLSLREIGKLKGAVPFTAICNWITHHQEFALRLKTIRKTRGLIHEEKAIEIAENATPETVPVAKLQVETHKWVAEASDPETYGKRKQEAVAAPTTIIINTGVPDSEVEVKCEVVSPQVNESPQVNDSSGGEEKLCFEDLL